MAKRIPVLVLVPPILFAALALAFYVGMYRGNPADLPSAFIGKPAPAITVGNLPGFPALDPEAETLSDGQVTLVNFWASWCPPCRAEHPQLLRFAQSGLRIIGVNYNDTDEQAAAYLTNYDNPFAAVPFDPKSKTAFDWGVAGPPETFILDHKGNVVFKFIGPLVGSDFEQRFMPALDAAIAAAQG